MPVSSVPIGELMPRSLHALPRLGTIFVHSVPRLRPSYDVVPIRATRTATVPAPAASDGRPDSGARSETRRSSTTTGRGVRQDVGVDRERVGVATPRDDAVARHPGELDRAVGEDHGAEGARVVAADPDELHPADDHEADGGGPAPDALRVGRERPRRAAQRAVRGAREAGDRAPRVEGGVEVSEDDRRERDGDPEHDPHERRREVRRRVRRARERAHDHDGGHAPGRTPPRAARRSAAA